MRTRRAALWLVVSAVLAGAAPRPQRIVSTAPSITEILYALGLGDCVVGVTRFCRYPPEAQLKPKIGDYINPNLEAITALKPDLVVVQTNPVRLSERLNALHLRTLEVDQQDIAAIYKSIRRIGDAAGVAQRADELIASIRAGLDAVRAQAAKVKPVRVMFVVGRPPGRLDGLMVAGRASYLSEVLRIAGGENVFGDAAAAYPQVSLEEVIARNPEVILDMGDMGDATAISETQKRETIELWRRRLAVVNAAKMGRVYPIASDIYVVPGPRVVDAARAIFTLLHPEAP